MNPAAIGSVTVRLADTAVAPPGTGDSPATGIVTTLPPGTAPEPPSGRSDVRESRMRVGLTPWNEAPPEPNQPVTSTTRFVSVRVYRQTRRLDCRGTSARFGVGSPTRGLTWEASGRSFSQGYTVTYPSATALTAMTSS